MRRIHCTVRALTSSRWHLGVGHVADRAQQAGHLVIRCVVQELLACLLDVLEKHSREGTRVRLAAGGCSGHTQGASHSDTAPQPRVAKARGAPPRSTGTGWGARAFMSPKAAASSPWSDARSLSSSSSPSAAAVSGAARCRLPLSVPACCGVTVGPPRADACSRVGERPAPRPPPRSRSTPVRGCPAPGRAALPPQHAGRCPLGGSAANAAASTRHRRKGHVARAGAILHCKCTKALELGHELEVSSRHFSMEKRKGVRFIRRGWGGGTGGKLRLGRGGGG